MNTYEALIVFKPVLDVDNTEGVVKGVENTIQNLKGKVLKLEKVGRKRLAYEVSKFKDGFVTLFWFQLDPAAVAEFKKYCQLSEDIIRLTLVRQDQFDPAAPVNLTTAIGAPYNPREREFHPRGDREHRGDRGDFRGRDRDSHGGDRPHGDRPHGDRPHTDRPPMPAGDRNRD